VFARFSTLMASLVPTPRPLDDDDLDDLEDLPPIDRPSAATTDDATNDVEFALEVPEAAPSTADDDATEGLPLDGLVGTLAEEASALGDDSEGPLAHDDVLREDLDEETTASFLGRDDSPTEDGADDIEDEPLEGEDDGGAEGFATEDTMEPDELPPLDGQDDGDALDDSDPLLES